MTNKYSKQRVWLRHSVCDFSFSYTFHLCMSIYFPACPLLAYTLSFLYNVLCIFLFSYILSIYCAFFLLYLFMNFLFYIAYVFFIFLFLWCFPACFYSFLVNMFIRKTPFSSLLSLSGDCNPFPPVMLTSFHVCGQIALLWKIIDLVSSWCI